MNFQISTALAIVLLALATAPRALSSDAAPTNKPACCLKTLVGAPVSDRSLYQLDTVWTNDAARPVKLVSFQGKPQVVVMFFTTCTYACPLLVNDMKRIEAALPKSARTNVGFLMISFDTERDTPAVLSAWRARRKLPANWSLLRGSSDDVLEIAALLGVKFKKDARGDFAHSNIISLLDKNGEIVTQQTGLGADPAAIAVAIRKAIKP